MRRRSSSVLYYWFLTVTLLTEDGLCFLVGRTRSYGGRHLLHPSHRPRTRNHQNNDRLASFKAKWNALVKQKTSNKVLQERNELYVETSRVEECNLDYGLRMDCGYFGIKQDECYQRECCWGETTEPDVPWCYHSKTAIKSSCLLEKLERQECGWYGIRKEQCLARNCCWQPTNDNNIPWCFQPLHKPMFEGQCGISLRPPSTSSRIVGGTEAIPYSWPWMASLQVDDWHFCGGTLINDQWVVSAAHCVGGFLRATKRYVVLGVHDWNSREETQIRIEVDTLLPHANFGEMGMENDIMLIKMKRPVRFSDTVTPICLPVEGQDPNPGKHCYTTGWGLLREGEQYADKLQQVMVPIINASICGGKDWYDGLNGQSMLCAGYEEGGRDSCQGDSGGPLACNIDGIWTLFGVASWGKGCARERKPGVYSKVSHFVKWIETTIGNNSKSNLDFTPSRTHTHSTK